MKEWTHDWDFLMWTFDKIVDTLLVTSNRGREQK